MKPLAHIKILDLTHMLSGPYATQLLADLGAETIKIEAPVFGEGTRRLLEKDPLHSIDGMGAYFLTLGRNKQSVSIDLKIEAGKSLFYRLVETADVVIYNFRAGVAEKLGIDHCHLMEINPRIVTCSITGFGETGRNKDALSFDLVAQAAGGGMSITGSEDNPLRSGIPIGDLGGGMMGAIGILAALQARVATGRGQHVDISMQDAQISMLNYMATMFFMSGTQPPAIGNSHFVHVPYDSFKTRDGHIILAIITDSLWEKFISLTPLTHLDTQENKAQPGRWKNRQLIMDDVTQLIATEDNAYWLEKLQNHGIPCAPVNNFAAALNDPHIHDRNMIVEVPHPNGTKTKQVGNPIKLSEYPEEEYLPPPLLGQDTDQVLKTLLGLREETLKGLRSQGIIQ
ncbi:MAG: CoA transferase [Proteobacteria bacterium]|nr:CoA transferase [Pseudomonadota bacterium]